MIHAEKNPKTINASFYWERVRVLVVREQAPVLRNDMRRIKVKKSTKLILQDVGCNPCYFSMITTHFDQSASNQMETYMRVNCRYTKSPKKSCVSA
jgi:hypothetical protein